MYQRQVSFSEAISMAFANYCKFSGRSSRSEFWWFFLFNFIISFALGIIGMMLFGIDSENYLQILYGLAVFLPGLGLSVRRLHDIGRAGGWIFLSLIPLVGGIILIVWYCQDSQRGANRFGEEPNVVE